MPEHLWTSKHRKKMIGVSSSKSLQYNCLSNGNSPLININGSAIHTSPREQTPKSWSAASLEANQMLSVLSNRFGWTDSRSRTATRFSANFKCGGEPGTERSPGKRMLWLNHRVKVSMGGWSSSMRLPATASSPAWQHRVYFTASPRHTIHWFLQGYSRFKLHTWESCWTCPPWATPWALEGV